MTPASIYWIESENLSEIADGTLTRIEKYNSQNRMVEAVVSLTNIKSVSASGMFCKVIIQGKEIKNVFKIPRVALTKNNEAMVIDGDRLKFHPARVIYTDGDFIFIESGSLKENCIFVNSKIASPVEGMKVEVEFPADEKG